MTHQFYTRGEALWSLFDGRFKNRFGAAYTDVCNWNKPPTLAPNTNQGTRDKYNWLGELALAPGHTLLMGLENDTERMKLSTTPLVRSNSNNGAFVELQSEFAKRFFIVANVRHDDNERFGGHTTWRVAPAFIVPVSETKLKASYGTGFKAPSLNQLFVDFPPFFFANPNLRPEISAGLRLRLRAAAAQQPRPVRRHLFPQRHPGPDQLQHVLHDRHQHRPGSDARHGIVRVGRSDRPAARARRPHLYGCEGRSDRS